jgi:hypothetical protein
MSLSRNTRRAALGSCALALFMLTGAAQPLLAAGGAGSVRVGPHPSTAVRGVTDCDEAGLGGACDMVGAVSGSVRYMQRDDGTLLLTVRMQFARPGTTYDFFLTDGPSHRLANGFTPVGSLTTNSKGAGERTVAVPLATLRGLGGAGYHTDHVDVGARSSFSFFVAGALNYFVPRGTTTSAARVTPGDATLG